MEGLPKRKTRIQIAVIENGKVILVKTHMKKEGRYFWGLPGGGMEPGETEEETALREVREETGLEVHLLPFRIPGPEYSKLGLYENTLTFLAVSLSGEAQTGNEPEPEMQPFFALVDLRWQEVNDDTDLDDISMRVLAPVRALLESGQVRRRAGAVVCRREAGQAQVFLIASRMNPGEWIFPAGKLEVGETPLETAQREAWEEGGVKIDRLQSAGFFLQEWKNGVVRTDMFLAVCREQWPSPEGRETCWMTLPEAQSRLTHRDGQRLLRELDFDRFLSQHA